MADLDNFSAAAQVRGTHPVILCLMRNLVADILEKSSKLDKLILDTYNVQSF
jgi:hypothetical protein